ncbi:MAG: InlB B-repeat-containing protein [Spirochaetota bacterium]|jgi:predicted outer membrane repeat protein|nr:InlB B-repeat-containing protein [Spirochaetota bacterium]
MRVRLWLGVCALSLFCFGVGCESVNLWEAAAQSKSSLASLGSSSGESSSDSLASLESASGESSSDSLASLESASGGSSSDSLASLESASGESSSGGSASQESASGESSSGGLASQGNSSGESSSGGSASKESASGGSSSGGSASQESASGGSSSSGSANQGNSSGGQPQPPGKIIITFDSDGGTDVSSQPIDPGGTASKPPDPTKTGWEEGLYCDPPEEAWEFKGWFINDDATEAFDFGTPISEPLTLTARWKSAAIKFTATQTGNNIVEKAVSYVKANVGEYILYLSSDHISVAQQPLFGANVKLTIRGISPVTIQASGPGLFTIDDGAELILEQNVTLRGMPGDSTLSFIQVLKGGTFTMQGGAITGHTIGSNQYNAPVKVDSGGTFDMSRGSIHGNKNNSTGKSGAAVYVACGAAGTPNNTPGGIFNMSKDAEIRDNISGSGVDCAAVYLEGSSVFENAVFIMSGGKIYDNTSQYTASGAFTPCPADVYVQNAVRPELSGNAHIGALILDSSGTGANATAASVVLSTGFTGLSGEVTSIHLIASSATATGGIQAVKDAWDNKKVIAGEGSHTPNATQIGKFTLGEFREPSEAARIEDTHIFSSDDPGKIGTLIPGTVLSGNVTSTILQSTIQSAVSGATIVIPAGVCSLSPSVTIDKEIILTTKPDAVVTFTRGDHNFFTINNGGNLTLRGGSGGILKLDGNNQNHNNPGITVNSGGQLTMNSGAQIVNCKNNNIVSGYDNAGGVHIRGGATFNMYDDALISGNTAYSSGGGVYCKGTFNMYGGTISNNIANNGGGAVCVDGNDAGSTDFEYRGIFTMNYGIICGNSSTSTGGEWYQGSGGGVFVHGKCTFTMNDGHIYDNWAATRGGGVCIRNDSNFTKSVGVIYGNDVGEPDWNRVPEDGSVPTGAGAAVCSVRADDTIELCRDSTAWAGDNMNSVILGPSGGWE